MYRLIPLVLSMALAGLAPPSLAGGAGARATPGPPDHEAPQWRLPLGKRTRLEAWPTVDRFEFTDGTDSLVRLHAGVGLRYARDGFSFGAGTRYRVAGMGHLPAEDGLDDHQLLARFGFDF